MYKKPLLLLFLFSSIIGYSQTINGHITDKKNNRLPSVNISISNQNTGVTSNNNGEYTLQVPKNKSIVIIYSSIGYQTEKIRIPILKEDENYTLEFYDSDIDPKNKTKT